MDALKLAQDIMVTKLVTVSPTTDILTGIRTLLDNGITGAPVVAADRTFLGMLSERSCLDALTRHTVQARAKQGRPDLPAGDFMAHRLFTLAPDTDCYVAIDALLKRRYSGAPVVDAQGQFLGVFSERYSMKLLVHSAWDQVPYANVGAFMNPDRGRLIAPDTDLVDVAKRFLDTYYRRLPVLEGDRLVGQVSRRDVLRAEYDLATATGESRLDEDPLAGSVSDFMETAPETIAPEVDFMVVAQTFLHSNRRRLPVLRSSVLVGQISRRDLLESVLASLEVPPPRTEPGLYLSAVADRDETPILEAPQRRAARATAHGGAHPHHPGPRP